MYNALIAQEIIENSIKQSIETIQKSLVMSKDVEQVSQKLLSCLKNNNKLLICGNGGSAADSQHMVAEIIGRFETERKAFPAIALNTDTSILTAVANDYGYEYIFSRQVEGLGNNGDILIGFSTSGNSQNVLNAIKVAKSKNMFTICFSGKDGGKIKDIADINLIVPSSNTARIQEVHGIWIHALCQIIDKYIEEN